MLLDEVLHPLTIDIANDQQALKRSQKDRAAFQIPNASAVMTHVP